MKPSRISPWFFAFVLFGAFSASFACATKAFASMTPQVSVRPTQAIQGDPVMITLSGIASPSEISKAAIALGGNGANATSKTTSYPLYFTMYKNMPTAIYGIDISAATGTATISISLKNGSIISGNFSVLARTKYELPLPVPEKLGGNSTKNATRIVSVLDKENAQITAIAAATSKKEKAFWTSTFAYPLQGQILVTDPYGYLRDTGNGAATITHKGTDFRAAVGTPVYAINDGIVRLTKTFTVYGKTVIIDHGLGIESLYMHLSKIKVTSGTYVKKGTLLGYSGDTGYAEAPHLHLSIRIRGISIDPMKFFELFNPQEI